MKKILLFAAIIGGIIAIACNKQTILPAPASYTVFAVTSAMSHTKDTINATGDTLGITAQGSINDTSRTYAISGSFTAKDSVTKTVLSSLYVKSLKLTFDTVGMYKTGLYHWKSTVLFPIPTVTAKSKIQTTAIFSYGLNTSSHFGNLAATDSKYTYAK